MSNNICNQTTLRQLMAENDTSWFLEDNSWRKTTRYGTRMHPPFAEASTFLKTVARQAIHGGKRPIGFACFRVNSFCRNFIWKPTIIMLKNFVDGPL